ncbi:MAG: hypothetical protein AAFQ99_06135 [Pseudomonadota bacterium]
MQNQKIHPRRVGHFGGEQAEFGRLITLALSGSVLFLVDLGRDTRACWSTATTTAHLRCREHDFFRGAVSQRMALVRRKTRLSRMAKAHLSQDWQQNAPDGERQ